VVSSTLDGTEISAAGRLPNRRVIGWGSTTFSTETRSALRAPPIDGSWSSPGFTESRCWTSCHNGCVLVLYRGQHAEAAVTPLPVVEDLEVVEDRVGQLDPGVPASAVQ